MKITYIFHSGFLVETDRFCYLFDYEKGPLPEADPKKPILVLSSHGHGDHYNEEVFSLLRASGTEPLIRVMAEAKTRELAESVVDAFVDLVNAL